jgi:acetylornithine deacetylase
MKAGLAAAMVAAAEVRGLRGDVILAAVCDEEAGSIGTKAFVRNGPRVDAAIVTEPTDLAIAVAHKGFVGFEIETKGRAAHGSQPHLGVDAIANMGPVLVELRALAERVQQGREHPLIGAESMHTSLIKGGQEFSTYPQHCVLSGEWRTLPGGSDVADELQRAIDRSGVSAEMRVLFTGAPFEAPADHEIIDLLRKHANARTIGAPYWADSAVLAGAGIPTVLFGPSGEGAHADVEWVDLASVTRTKEVLVAVAQDYCG